MNVKKKVKTPTDVRLAGVFCGTIFGGCFGVLMGATFGSLLGVPMHDTIFVCCVVAAIIGFFVAETKDVYRLIMIARDAGSSSIHITRNVCKSDLRNQLQEESPQQPVYAVWFVCISNVEYYELLAWVDNDQGRLNMFDQKRDKKMSVATPA